MLIKSCGNGKSAQASWHRDIGTSGHRDIGTSGHRDIGASGNARTIGASGTRSGGKTRGGRSLARAPSLGLFLLLSCLKFRKERRTKRPRAGPSRGRRLTFGYTCVPTQTHPACTLLKRYSFPARFLLGSEFRANSAAPCS